MIFVQIAERHHVNICLLHEFIEAARALPTQSDEPHLDTVIGTHCARGAIAGPLRLNASPAPTLFRNCRLDLPLFGFVLSFIGKLTS